MLGGRPQPLRAEIEDRTVTLLDWICARVPGVEASLTLRS